MSVHEISIQPLKLWIELGGKPKWLSLKCGYHDVMRTGPIDQLGQCLYLILYMGHRVFSKGEPRAVVQHCTCGGSILGNGLTEFGHNGGVLTETAQLLCTSLASRTGA